MAGERIKQIKPPYNKSLLLKFQNEISKGLSKASLKLQRTQNRQKDISNIQASLSAYYKNLNELSKVENRIKNLTLKVSKFKKKSELEQKLKNLFEIINNHEKEKQEIIEINLLFNDYQKHLNDLKEHNKEIEKLKNLAETELKIKAKNELETKVYNDQLSEIDEEIYKANEKKDNVVNLYTELKAGRLSEKKVKNTILDYDNKIKSIKKEIKIIEKSINELNSKISQVNDNEYRAIKEDKGYIDQCKKIINITKYINEAKVDLKKIKINLQEQEGIAENIQSILAYAAQIVNETKSRNCPVCNHKYKNYENLLNNITNNSAISDNIKIILKEKTAYENSIKRYQKEIEKIKNQITNKLNKDQQRREKQLDSLNSQLEQHINIKDNLISENEEQRTRNIALLELTENLSQNDLTKKIASYIVELNEKKKKIKDKKKRLSENIKTNKNNIKQKKIEIQANEETISSSKKNKSLIKYNQFIEKHGYSQKQISYEFIKKLHNENDLAINNTVKEINQCNSLIENLNKKLISENEEKLEKDISESKIFQSKLTKQIEKYKNIYYDLMKTKIQRKTKSQIKIYLEKEKKTLERQIYEIEEKINNYKLIDSYKKNLNEILRYEEIMIKIKNIKKELENLEKVDQALLKEKENISNILEIQIEEFFHQSLINKIYEKIAPHPEYKKMKFDVDFQDDTPKLHVYVEGERESIIPSLYFSTAQLNILSLSIFLAKALNAVDNEGNSVDCIFLDDPIPSMDSINILSTIDLFRSLVVNYGKQLIVSTHDENLFQLLQKKIPSNIFKAKFLTLETFGKVKSSK